MEIRFAGFFQSSNLLVGQVPEAESLTARAEKRRGGLGCAGHLTLGECLLGLQCEEVLLFGAHQVWTVDREKRFTLADRRSGVVDEEFLDVPADLESDGGDFPLVDVEAADRAD